MFEKAYLSEVKNKKYDEQRRARGDTSCIMRRRFRAFPFYFLDSSSTSLPLSDYYICSFFFLDVPQSFFFFFVRASSLFFSSLFYTKECLVQRRNPRISPQKASAVTTTAPHRPGVTCAFCLDGVRVSSLSLLFLLSFFSISLFFSSHYSLPTLIFFYYFFRSLYLTCACFYHSQYPFLFASSPRLRARVKDVLPPCVIYL